MSVSVHGIRRRVGEQRTGRHVRVSAEDKLKRLTRMPVLATINGPSYEVTPAGWVFSRGPAPANSLRGNASAQRRIVLLRLGSDLGARSYWTCVPRSLRSSSHSNASTTMSSLNRLHGNVIRGSDVRMRYERPSRWPRVMWLSLAGRSLRECKKSMMIASSSSSMKTMKC